jgi:putative pyridoxal-dependent aspartate 1-decarboxylase
MVLLSGLNILLYRYTHQETIVVGTPIANRHFREIEGLVGFFINTLALKTDVKGEMSFVELLNEVREMTLKGYAHQDLPFEKLIDHLQIARSVNRQPLFQVMLTLQNNDPMEYSMQGLEVQSFDLDYPIAKFDLSLYATEQLDNTIHLAFEYATDLFEERTIVQLANHLVQILIAIIKYPNIRVGELPFLNINEQQQLLINWNQTKYPYPQYTTIHQLFELQVNKTPKDLAVLFEGQIFTYEMLNKVANQFAHYLHHLEIKKSTPIIVYLDHSIELIITLLGILKAGNIYTPADPKYYSQNRLEYLIQDTSSPVIITNKVIWNKVDLNLTNVLFWEDISGKMKACSGENLDCEISSEDTAYIIYTSGSTGLPKGVLGSHRGMINRLVWSWQTFPFKKDDVCYQKASINFVDHIAEYFSPLLYGIPLVLASKNVVNEVNIYQMIKDIFIHKVTRIVVVPSLLRVILEEGKDDISKLQSLRYIFCSGEALSVELANYTYTLLPEIELVNIYGSSEVSADVSYHCFVKQHSTVIKHFSENLQYMEAYLPLVKQNLVTTPFIQLESLKETFQANQIPILPVDFDEYRRYLDNYVLPYSVNTTASRFVGHMTSVMPKFVYDLNKLIVMLNQNLVKIETSKSFTLLEREAIAMLHHSFYEQPDSFYQEHSQNELSALGLVVSNGSIANISALWLARNHSLGADGHFKGIAEEGLNKALNHYGYQDCIVIASSLLHYSFEKAASLLGIGKRQIYHLPRTSDGEVNIDALRGLIIDCREKSIHIMAIVGIAGTTETGAIDPLFELSKIANEFSIHFHVDAAFGGPLIFSAKHKNLLAGIEHADSITICGHKQLYLSMGISICLFRNPDAANAILNTADYQATRESLDSGKISLEGSRSAMSILLHACLHLIGKKGYEELITTSINNTQYFRNIISSHGAFELILEPEINIINYRYIPLEFREKVKSCSLSKQDNEHIDKANILLQKQQFLQGQTFVSKTQVYVSKYQTELISLRAVLVNPLISENDLSAVLRDQLEIASKYIENKFDVLNNNFEITNITQNDLSNSYTVAIGRPIANTQMYILDKYLLPVPIGVVGQLYVGGANLSNGYLNQPMLTAEKFVPNPFYDGNDTTTRLYQTGDLARYLANGNIEYLGRVDDQIKIRGIRVELKEIETVVKNQTNIQNVVVVTRENSALQQQLIAYLVLSEGLMDTNEYIDNLRQELSKQLPEYMIPNAFIVLDQLPLNASGKIDKKALPLPTQFHSSTKEYIAPRNQIEQKLTEIWSALLNMKLSEISINESFFKLGGHSLLATRLISRINQVFNVKFELKNLFTLTTIMEIAANIQKSDISNLLDELDTDELNLIQFDEEEITLLKS